MRPGVRRVHLVSLGSQVCALGVVVLIQGGWVHCCARVVGFIRVCRVAPRGSSGSSAFVAFIWVRPCGRRFIRGRWVHCGAPWSSSDSSEVAAFIGVHPGVGRFHPGSLGSLGCTVVVVGFVRARWVHWGAA